MRWPASSTSNCLPSGKWKLSFWNFFRKTR
jgi:hypothetical protein